jgi:hypothetical protein
VRLYKPIPPDAPGGSSPYVLIEQVAYGPLPPWPPLAAGGGYAMHRMPFTGYANEPTNWVDALPVLGPPGLADTDSDGMPNSWEALYNFNQNSAADAGGDADNDGLSNLQEYIAGTHPRDPSSYLRINVVAGTPDVAVLQFNAVAGKTYTIFYSDSLAPGTWFRLVDIAPRDATGPLTIYDSTAQGPRFYRLRTP